MKILTFLLSGPSPSAVEAVIHRLYEAGDKFSMTYTRSDAGAESETRIHRHNTAEESISRKLLGFSFASKNHRLRIYNMQSPQRNQAV